MGTKLKNPPGELVDYLLCEKFGWTPDELDRQDSDRVKRFIIIMNIEKQHKDQNGLPNP